MDYSDFYRIIKSKKENRDKLDDLMSDVSVFIYAATLKGDDLYSVKKQVIDMIKATGLSRMRMINRRLLGLSSRVWRKSQTPGADSSLVFQELDRQDSLKPTEKAMGKWLRDEEAKQKEIVLEKSLKEPDEPSDDISKLKAFCLCSRHNDCAKDHLPYQGKLYVKRWALRYPEIKEWCEQRDIKTVEWVMGKPVWMTTRPNCRHFFAEITAKEAMGEQLDWLLKKHGMDRAVGTRGDQQNVRHPTDKGWYTEENVRRIIEQYRKRLEKHLKMRGISTNENLENAIAKDRMLILKWEQYLAKLKKEGKV